MLRKKLMETEILLMKMGIAYFKLVSMRANAKKNLWLLTSFIQMICMWHFLEAPGPYQ